MIYIFELTDQQKDILDCNNNIVVSADAGTGKTATMILKIERELEKNISFKSIGAITYTIKATKEIRDRLHKNSSKVVVNTNNGFVFEEIIKPFFKDYNRDGFSKILNTDYNKKFNTYDEGIDLIISDGTIGSYIDAKKNFIFELATEILVGSLACQKYIKAKYLMIFIDEYQDCDLEMHNLFMKFNKELGIKLFIIGDMKQSIYMWKNSKPELFKKVLDDKNFSTFPLTINFRSTKTIQNYANTLIETTRDLIDIDNMCKKDVFFVSGPDEESNFVKAVSLLNMKEPFALLRFSNPNAEKYAEKFKNIDINCVYIPRIPISEITTNSSWIYNNMLDYLLIEKYSEYNFIMEIPGGLEEGKNEIVFTKKILRDVKSNYIANQKDKLFENIKKIGNYFNYEIRNDHLELFYDSVTNSKYINAIKIKEKDNCSMTFHSSKGLQFQQVILFAEDYRLNDDESLYNHYVASTRAKKKLIIICKTNEYNAQQYIKNFQIIMDSCNLKPSQLFEK